MDDNNASDKTVLTPDSGQFADPRFKIQKKLGSGGMGDVYLAEDSKLHRLVALKTVRPDLCRIEEIRKRIERECLLHARVGAHPHIVTLFDKLERDDNINLVMEYVEGGTLQDAFRECVKRGFEFSKKDALNIAAQVLEALSRIHAQGIVHRDIKPENILLVNDESSGYCAKLMDFGIARLQDASEQATCLTSAEGASPGTPLFMAPEQIDPKTYGAVSAATDIYAVGVLLYQLLTGHLPFTGTMTEVFRGHLTGIPPALDAHSDLVLPAAYADILRRALAKEPTDRFQTAKAFREELLRVTAVMTGAATTPGESAADTSKTVVASGSYASHAESGGTQLAGTGLQRTRGGGKTIIVAVVVLLIVVAVAAGAAWKFMSKKTEPSTEPVSQPPVPTAVVPATSPTAPPPTPIPAEHAKQPTTPSGPTELPAIVPPLPPATTPAVPGPAAPVPVVQPSASGGSALDALEKRRLEAVPEPEPVAAPAPPAPEPPRPQPTPEPKPEPKPQAKPAPSQTPKPATLAEPAPVPTPVPSPAPAPAATPAAPAQDNSWLNGVTGSQIDSKKKPAKTP